MLTEPTNPPYFHPHTPDFDVAANVAGIKAQYPNATSVPTWVFTCGNGNTTRQRQVLSPSPACDNAPLTDTQSCSVPCPVDCQVVCGTVLCE